MDMSKMSNLSNLQAALITEDSKNTQRWLKSLHFFKMGNIWTKIWGKFSIVIRVYNNPLDVSTKIKYLIVTPKTSELLASCVKELKNKTIISVNFENLKIDPKYFRNVRICEVDIDSRKNFDKPIKIILDMEC